MMRDDKRYYQDGLIIFGKKLFVNDFSYLSFFRAAAFVW